MNLILGSHPALVGQNIHRNGLWLLGMRCRRRANGEQRYTVDVSFVLPSLLSQDVWRCFGTNLLSVI